MSIRYEAPDVLESQSGEFSNSVGDLSEYDTEADLRTGIERLEREHAVVLNVLQEKFDPVSLGDGSTSLCTVLLHIVNSIFVLNVQYVSVNFWCKNSTILVNFWYNDD